MVTNYNLRTATFVCLIGLLALVVISCTKKDDATTNQVQLLSFGPSGVKHGEDISFIGTGLDKVTSIVMPEGVEVPSSAFKTQTSSLITLTVPMESTEGKVTLKTLGGDIVSKASFGSEYIISVASVTAVAKPGTDITISGDYLNYVKQITFTDKNVVTTFVSQTKTELVVTVPLNAKTGRITLSDGKKKPQLVNYDGLTLTIPTVSNLSPSSLKHLDNLTITGTDLDLVTKIDFTNASVQKASFVSQSETSIVVAVPATTKDGKLTLTIPSGVTVVTNSISIILPNVTALSPSDLNTQQTAGTTLTLTGTNLDLVAKIAFPTVSAPVTSFVSQSASQIQVIVPVGTQGGTLVMTTIHGFSVPITVPFGNQLTLATPIFDEVNHGLSAWGGWGGVVTDVANTEQARVGTKAVKVTYGGNWGGGAQFGGGSVSTSGSTYYAFSIYGGSGTNGKNINVNVAGTQVQIPVIEGAWKDVKILLSAFGSPATVSEVWFQDTGWSGVVYIDQIGFK